MIRYVFIRESDMVLPDGPAFAWFDTVTDTFLSFNGEQVWGDWDDFAEAWQLDSAPSKPSLERLKNLYPRKSRGT